MGAPTGRAALPVCPQLGVGCVRVCVFLKYAGAAVHAQVTRAWNCKHEASARKGSGKVVISHVGSAQDAQALRLAVHAAEVPRARARACIWFAPALGLHLNERPSFYSFLTPVRGGGTCQVGCDAIASIPK